MQYPALTNVDQASLVQLGRWMRFLPTPGVMFSGTEDFSIKWKEESEIFERISKRFQDLGGWTPELSKEVGLKN